MMMEQERRQIVETGRLMYDRGLVQMSGGNISIIDRNILFIRHALIASNNLHCISRNHEGNVVHIGGVNYRYHAL